jgi:hypothetical protein
MYNKHYHTKKRTAATGIKTEELTFKMAKINF